VARESLYDQFHLLSEMVPPVDVHRDTATTREQAAEIVTGGIADAVTIGREYLANPDLVRRWTEGAALNAPRTEFLYSGGALGYTDYPTLPGRQR
jgi:2,4-dienoyl-CoA reductase-like NADH-dependent reductase (Old Yellow Enzyme family)